MHLILLRFFFFAAPFIDTIGKRTIDDPNSIQTILLYLN